MFRGMSLKATLNRGLQNFFIRFFSFLTPVPPLTIKVSNTVVISLELWMSMCSATN